jgi:hypothetical protein
VPINYTRQQLEGFLRSGQSVLVNGRHIDRLEDLPPESELAAGDRERARAALEAHDDQIARLVAERGKLARAAEAPAPPPAPAPVQVQAQPPGEPPGEPPAPPPPEPPPARGAPAEPPPPPDEQPPPPREEEPPPREDDRPGLFVRRKK